MSQVSPRAKATAHDSLGPKHSDTPLPLRLQLLETSLSLIPFQAILFPCSSLDILSMCGTRHCLPPWPFGLTHFFSSLSPSLPSHIFFSMRLYWTTPFKMTNDLSANHCTPDLMYPTGLYIFPQLLPMCNITDNLPVHIYIHIHLHMIYTTHTYIYLWSYMGLQSHFKPPPQACGRFKGSLLLYLLINGQHPWLRLGRRKYTISIRIK